jgi:serine protease Do
MDLYQQALVQKISQVTVGLQIGPTQGSGVLVSEDGHVLTAAHVAGKAGLEVRVIMPDGQRYRGTTLGMNKGVDAAMLKIDPPVGNDEKFELPFAEMGQAAQLQPGSWCLAMGHPGGYQLGRQPVARFGRVLAANKTVITTDCKLIGGDSGGPLFDMEGKVIGIHSRIGSKVTKNLHVPVDNYRNSWTRLVRGDTWGSLLEVVGRPVIGVLGDEETEEARIAEVLPASPAERAGVRPGDLVTRFDSNEVESFDDLKRFVGQRQPGDEVTVEVLRGSEKLQLKVVLAAIARG